MSKKRVKKAKIKGKHSQSPSTLTWHGSLPIEPSGEWLITTTPRKHGDSLSHIENHYSHTNSRGSLVLSKVYPKGLKWPKKGLWGIDLQKIVGEGHITTELITMDQRARPPSFSLLARKYTSFMLGHFYIYVCECVHTCIWVLTYSARFPNSGPITYTIVTNTHLFTHFHLMHDFVINASGWMQDWLPNGLISGIDHVHHPICWGIFTYTPTWTCVPPPWLTLDPKPDMDTIFCALLLPKQDIHW